MRAGFWRLLEALAKRKIRATTAINAHVVEGMLTAVESGSPIGAHVNLHTLYPDGRVVTFTNSELPMPKALRPNVQRIRLPRCSPDALVARARSERPKLPFRPLSVEEAPRLYEQLYADEIRFRKSAGK
jgi:hypothetical protein